MKLSVLCRYFPKDAVGGGENYVYEVWKRAKKDYDVSLICGWKKDKRLLPKETNFIDIRSRNTFVRYWRYYWGSKKHLEKIKPDVIFSTCYEFPCLNIPTVITVCHLGHLFGRVGSSYKLSFQKWLTARRLKKADKVIAISQTTMNDLIRLGVKDVMLAYPGIDVDRFKPKKSVNDKFTIVCPSRISKEKGQHVVVNALKKLSPEVLKKVKLQLVGFVNDDNYVSELKKLAAGLPVEIIVNVESIEDYVNNSDLVVFPTLMWEGFGIVAGEALAAEKPLIASNYPAVKEVMGNYGVSVEPGDVDGFAKAIEKVFLSKENICKGSRDWIKKNFSWDNCYKVHKKVFDSV